MAQRPSVQYVQFYTDGSAARKVETVTPLPVAKLPKARKLKRITLHIDPVAIGGIAMAVVMLVLMLVGVGQLISARQNVAQLENRVAVLQAEQRDLNVTYEGSLDIADVEKTALALGMVPKDQVKHVLMQVPEVPQEKTPGAWEQIYMFLAGLFA